MIRNVLSVLALGALAGCAGPADPVAVYLLEMGYLMAGDEPTETITHNYLNATPEVDEPEESPWTTTGTFDVSAMLVFAEVYALEGEGEFVMIANGSAMPGAEQEDGTFLFGWTNHVDESDTETHSSGYTYTEAGSVSLTMSMVLDLESETGETTLDIEWTQHRSYSETDTWNVTEIGQSGQTPAESYLDSTQTEGYVYNDGTLTDCTGTPCTIDATWTMAGSVPVVVTRTNIEPGDFETVDYAGQPFGLPEDSFWGPMNSR